MMRFMIKKSMITVLAVLMIQFVFANDVYGGDRDFIYVDDDADPGWYDGTHVMTIQEGVDAAAPGDTVFVYNGTYYEHVMIDVRIDLIGEDLLHTIIDCSGGGNVVTITMDLVNLENFTIQNGLYGVWAEAAWGITISRNIIRYNITAFPTGPSFPDPIAERTNQYYDRLSSGSGIVLHHAAGSQITDNDLVENNAGVVSLGFHWHINRVYHNNFLHNKITQAYGGVRNGEWDNGHSGGNYWSDHLGTDSDGDGISDFRYVIPPKSWNIDHYPFMRPYGWKFKNLLERPE